MHPLGRMRRLYTASYWRFNTTNEIHSKAEDTEEIVTKKKNAESWTK